MCAGGSRVVGDQILLAVGRDPVVDGLGLDEVGIAHGRRDRHGPPPRTTLPHVYSVGDAKGGMMFTHVATYEAPYAVANMLDGADARARLPHDAAGDLHGPRARGRRPHGGQARAAGHDVEIRRSDVGTRGKARAIGDRRGRVKFVLDARTGVILGVGILARDGADLLPGPQVAMNAPGGTLAPLLATVHAHPTIAEAVKSWRAGPRRGVEALTRSSRGSAWLPADSRWPGRRLRPGKARTSAPARRGAASAARGDRPARVLDTHATARRRARGAGPFGVRLPGGPSETPGGEAAGRRGGVLEVTTPTGSSAEQLGHRGQDGPSVSSLEEKRHEHSATCRRGAVTDGEIDTAQAVASPPVRAMTT